MAFDALQVGRIEVLALIDGDQDLGSPIAAAFPDIPVERLMAVRDHEPGIYGPDDSDRLRIRAWLVRHPAGVLLVDTGIGQSSAARGRGSARPGRCSMRSARPAHHRTRSTPCSSPTCTTTTSAERWRSTTTSFPRRPSRMPVRAADGRPRVATRSSLVSTPRTAYRNAAPEAARRRGCPGPHRGRPSPGERAGGTSRTGPHARSSGGQGPSRDRRAIISADAFNHPLQLANPDWPAVSDDVPALAAMTRRALLAEALSHPGTTLAPTHFTASFGHIRSGADGSAAWVPS